MQQNSDACLANFEITDIPITGIGEQDADVADGLIAKNPGVVTRAIGTQRDGLIPCAGTGKRHLLVPGAVACQQDLVARGKLSKLIQRRKSAPWLGHAVRAFVAAVRIRLIVDVVLGPGSKSRNTNADGPQGSKRQKSRKHGISVPVDHFVNPSSIGTRGAYRSLEGSCRALLAPENDQIWSGLAGAVREGNERNTTASPCELSRRS